MLFEGENKTCLKYFCFDLDGFETEGKNNHKNLVLKSHHMISPPKLFSAVTVQRWQKSLNHG